MKNIVNAKLIGLLFTLLPISAFADYYKCFFTEHFRTLLVSTNHTLVTVIDAGIGAKSLKITEQKFSNSILKMDLSDGSSLDLRLGQLGSDGMSDFIYPYEVIYQGQYGACEKSLSHFKSEIELWKSMIYPSGYSFAHFWPGEYGWAMGIKVLEETVVKPTVRWSDLRSHKQDTAKCTLKAGSLFSPQSKNANEIFAYLDTSHDLQAPREDSFSGVAKGDHLKYLSYLSEDYCLYETSKGKVVELECIDHKVDKVEIGFEEIPLGHWLFAQCFEGHYTWIHIDGLLQSHQIEEVFLGL